MIPAQNANVISVAIIFSLAIGEWIRPARGDTGAGLGRVATNLALGAANLLVALILPLSTGAAAGLARAHGWGAMVWLGGPNGWAGLDGWAGLAAATLAATAALSLANYLGHLAYHKIGWLWPLHAVHHRDPAVDLSTTLRTHPLAAVLDAALAGLAMLALGPPVAAAGAAAAVMFGTALFEHADLKLGPRLSSLLERVVMTPRLHLVHHARARALHDSNYGQLISLWDRLGGTYRLPPEGNFSLGLDSGA